jgi:hypothetical protein
MRLAPLLLLLAPLLACESPPAFSTPGGPPLAVALDARFPFDTLGMWRLDDFDAELATQLAKYNLRVVDARTAPRLLAEINLGVPGNFQAIDVYLVRDGRRTPAGRIHMTDLSPTTLEASAQLVAPVIARAAWGLGQPAR